jgi:hypothetical protein
MKRMTAALGVVVMAAVLSPAASVDADAENAAAFWNRTAPALPVIVLRLGSRV